MTSWVLVFLFTFNDGKQVTVTQPATYIEKYAPIRTLEKCERVAALREARINVGFAAYPGPVSSVTIHCKRRNHVRSKTR